MSEAENVVTTTKRALKRTPRACGFSAITRSICLLSLILIFIVLLHDSYLSKYLLLYKNVPIISPNEEPISPSQIDVTVNILSTGVFNVVLHRFGLRP